MGIFNHAFDKPGKGVDINAPQKRSFFRFFDIFTRKFSHFVRTNLMYSLSLLPIFVITFFLVGLITSQVFSAPMMQNVFTLTAEQMAESAGDPALVSHFFVKIIASFDFVGRVILSVLFFVLWGAGPATAGVTYILRNFAREEHAWIWSDFKDAAKMNFKQSMMVFLIDIILFVLLYMAIRFYGSMEGPMNLLCYVLWIVAVIYTIMHFYLYPMMITFDLSLKDLYRNAMLFTFAKLPTNLFVLVVLLFIHLGIPVGAFFLWGTHFTLIYLIFLILEFIVLISFSAFIVNFSVYPTIEKYMMHDRKHSA